jgi:ribosome-associated protein
VEVTSSIWKWVESSHEGVKVGAAQVPAGRSARADAGYARLAMPDPLGPLRVTRSITIPEHELRWRFSRSPGPGGQSVNSADSQASLSYDVANSAALGPVQRARALERLARRLTDGVLTITSHEERSQLRNREVARERLAATLAQAVAPPAPKRRPTKPSKAAVERRITEKRRRGHRKQLRRPAADDD